MPDLNGFEVLRELRADTRTGDIPVVIHSSYSIPSSDRERVNQPRISVFPKELVKQHNAANCLREILSSLQSQSKEDSSAKKQ